MGLFDRINKAWSGADFWDKKENKQQRDSFAQKDEEERRRKAEAKAQVQAQKQAQEAVRQRAQEQAQNRPNPSKRVDPMEALKKGGLDVPEIPTGVEALKKAPISNVPAMKNVESVLKKPNQSNINKFRDMFDANTDSDKYRRNLVKAKELNTSFNKKGMDPQKAVESAVKIAEGSATPHKTWYDEGRDFTQGVVRGAGAVAASPFRVVGGLAEDVTNLPVLGLRGIDLGLRNLTGREDQWGITQRAESGMERINEATFRPVNRGIDSAAEFIAGEDNIGGYKAANTGLEIIGAVASLGTSAAVSAGSKSSKIAQMTAKMNELLAAGKTDEAVELGRLILKTEKSASKAATVANQLGGNNPLASAIGELTDNPLDLIKRIRGSGTADDVVDAVQDVSKIEDAAKVEVAPGVFKSPTAPTKAPVPPTSAVPPVQTPAVPEGPFLPSPTSRPPAGVLPEVPPQAAPPAPPVPLTKAPLPAQTQMDNVVEQVQANNLQKAPEAPLPVNKVVETPNQVASEAVPAPVAPVKAVDPEEAAMIAKREQLIEERNILAREGEAVDDIEGQIDALNKMISDPEADALVKQADAETKGKKPTKPVEKAVDKPGDVIQPTAKTDTIESLREEARDYDNIVEWREKSKTNLIDENGQILDPVTGEKISARQFFDEAKAGKVEAPVETPKAVEPVKAESPKEMTLAQKDQLEIDRANSVRKAEGSEPLPDVVKTKVPTKAGLQKSVQDNVNKNGKVSMAWKKKQLADGADPTDVLSAVEKVEGKLVPDTPAEKLVKGQKATGSEIAKKTKKEAAKEGKLVKAAPKYTKSSAKTVQGETGVNASALERSATAYRESIKIDPERATIKKALDDVADDKMETHINALVKNGDENDPLLALEIEAIGQRLDTMVKNGTITDKKLVELWSGLGQKGAKALSKDAQGMRLYQATMANVPAPIRVDNEIEKMNKHFEKLGKGEKIDVPDEVKQQMVDSTRKFDEAMGDVAAAENKIDESMAKLTSKEVELTDAELSAMRKEREVFVNERMEAQKVAVEARQSYSRGMDSVKPKLSTWEKMQQWAVDSPDMAADYLRMSMLSGVSGRGRDAFSTTLNVIDQSVWRMGEAALGRVSNKVGGTNLIENVGSNASRKKGFKGAWERTKASFSGNSTLDEATGRATINDRSELKKGGDSISIYTSKQPTKNRSFLRKAASAPKNVIRGGVQAATDLSYNVYTDALYSRGMVAARENGLTGNRAKAYAEMFMERPTDLAKKDAANTWLENSGMHENFVSKFLTKYIADPLDSAGSKLTDSNGKRFVKKVAGRTVRTTTVPFVQYLGGATHSMFVKQNPLANIVKGADAALFKKNPQKFVEELSRGTWNTAKIGIIMGLVSSQHIEMSDTGADGKESYNGPYVVNTDESGNKTYVPASTWGIAAGSALVSAHYISKAYNDFQNGDIGSGMANSTFNPVLATLKVSGMDNLLTGENVFGGLPANAYQTFNSSSADAADATKSIIGGMVGDIGSQAVPALGRDINSVLDNNENINPTGEAADTSGKGENGKVDPIKKGVARVTSGIPFLSQNLPRKSGTLSKTPLGRVFNANKQSNQQAAAIETSEKKEATSISRGQSLFDDDKLTGLLGKEALAIHDKYKGDTSKASADDMDKIWGDVKKAKDRLREEGEFGSYGKVLQYELDEMIEKNDSTEAEVSKAKRGITRAQVSDKHNIDPRVYALYTGDGIEGGGSVSQTELKAMFDEDSEFYDKDMAEQLLFIDELFTENGISDNGKGIDPWTRLKYVKPKYGWGGSSGSGRGGGSGGSGGSGGKSKGVGTNFGTLDSAAKPSGANSQKYQTIQNTIPNLTAQTSKTNLKKKISVAKGVKL